MVISCQNCEIQLHSTKHSQEDYKNKGRRGNCWLTNTGQKYKELERTDER